MRTRLMITALLGLALTIGGCTSSASTTPATATTPATTPPWSADIVGHGNKLLVLRTAETTSAPDALEVDDLASGEAARVWAAPLGWDARLLCADRNGIAIALSRHGQSDITPRITTVPGSGRLTKLSPTPVDQRIVVLHPDGSALQSSLPAGSIGVVSSAAFLGDTLVIARQGPMFRYATPAEPALMDARGHFILLQTGAIRLDHRGLQSLVTLPEGGVAAGIFQGYGPMGAGPAMGVVHLRGGSLEVTETAPRRRGRETPDRMAAGPSTGTVIFAGTQGLGFVEDELVLADVFSTPASDSVLASRVSPVWPYGPNGPAPEATMGGGRYVVALSLMGRAGYNSPAEPRELASQPTTSSALATVDSSGKLHPTPVRLYAHPRQGGPDLPRADTWLWLGAFGR